MDDVLDFRLFRVGGAPVTVGSLVAALAVFAASWLLARFVRRIVAERFFAQRLAMGVRYAVARFLGYLILVLGAVIALETLGIHTTALAAFSAAIGVGIGFGLQDVAKNFISGLLLLVERTVQVGDRVELSGTAGDVVEIRTRATVIRTSDDVHVIVPNSKFITETVVNRTYGRSRSRYRIPVLVGKDADPRATEAALIRAAGRSQDVLQDPPPSVRLTRLGDGSLEFELVCWTSTMLHHPGALKSRLNFAIHEELTASGIPLAPPPAAPVPAATAGGGRS
jgi:small-conductance mechanosensitive channel